MGPPATATGSQARRVAHHVLMRVARDGAFSDRALDVAFGRVQLSDADRALVTELVYGVLRQQQRIDFTIARLATRTLRKIHPDVLIALRLGVYQLLETRVPAYAAVDESVQLVRSFQPHAAGFTNAVLRKIATLHGQGSLPKPTEFFANPIEALAVECSQPAWLLARVRARFGDEAMRAFAAANNANPVLALRVNPLRAKRDAVAKELADAGAEVDLPPQLPDALIVRGLTRMNELAAFRDGRCSVQDPAGQLVGYLCAPQRGMVALDTCAAPGNRATHLAELMQDQGLVLALDAHPGKVGLVEKSAKRLGLGCIRSQALDATDAHALVQHVVAETTRDVVDLALVCPPSTGLGMLRRNPEVRARLVTEIPLFVQTQDLLLTAAAEVVRPGGALVYVVATHTDEEGPERITAFLKAHPQFRPAWPGGHPVLERFASRDERFADLGPHLATWTHLHDTNGLFGIRLVRQS